MAIKAVYVGAVIILSMALIGGITVIGLLQSTERIGTSGVVTQPSQPSPPPPEPNVEIDVYSDSECTELISTIDWGSLEAGSSVSRMVYVKSAGNRDVKLSLTTENWNPAGAANYIELSWDYDGSTLEPGAVVGVTLTLTVNSSITGVEGFSFDIIIIGTET